MRNGREGLSGIIREKMQRDPYSYDEAFIFYSKDYRKVKILHYDINGFVLYQKWFDDGKFLKPRFLEAARCHKISRETLIFIIRKTKCYRIAKRNVQNVKRNVYILISPSNPVKTTF